MEIRSVSCGQLRSTSHGDCGDEAIRQRARAASCRIEQFRCLLRIRGQQRLHHWKQRPHQRPVVRIQRPAQKLRPSDRRYTQCLARFNPAPQQSFLRCVVLKRENQEIRVKMKHRLTPRLAHCDLPCATLARIQRQMTLQRLQRRQPRMSWRAGSFQPRAKMRTENFLFLARQGICGGFDFGERAHFKK